MLDDIDKEKRLIMDIEVTFIENKEVKKKTFTCYTMLGVWVSNNFGWIEILDIVVSEE